MALVLLHRSASLYISLHSANTLLHRNDGTVLEAILPGWCGISPGYRRRDKEIFPSQDLVKPCFAGQRQTARQTLMEITVPEWPVRVVVVDDSPDFRDFVASIVHSQPELQLVGEACDGEQAVRKIEALRPDLVLLDLGLPTLSGFEVIRIIRKTSPKSKIVFVSQESSPDVVQEALGLGASGYLLKSDVTNGVLGEAVSAVLQGRHFLSKTLARGGSN